MVLCRTTFQQVLAETLPLWLQTRAAAADHAEAHLRMLMANTQLQEELAAIACEELVWWQEPLFLQEAVTPLQGPSVAVGIDGSHIAPDYHVGLPCSVTNIGCCVLSYGRAVSNMQVYSHPRIHMNGYSDLPDHEQRLERLRSCAEIEHSVNFWHDRGNAIEQEGVPCVILLDGCLIPCALAVHERTLIEAWQAARVPVMGYVSRPHGMLLAAIVRRLCMHLCCKEWEPGSVEKPIEIFDNQLFSNLLAPGTRSVVWRISECVEAIYINTGYEAVRLEFPMYVRRRPEHWRQLLGVVIDQIQKGAGYPLCLAEAHQQAVLSEADRQFIAEQCRQVSGRSSLFASAKLLRKRQIPV